LITKLTLTIFAREENLRRMELSMQLNAIIEKDENGYFAYIAELKGCYSQGDTFEDALANIREAAELYIESLNEKEKNSLKDKSFVIAPINIQPLKAV
jgi:predicted RNase H-like HicB family nuclease